jgi:hypothetical protein
VVIAMGAATLILIGGLVIRFAFVTSPDQAAVKAAPRISDTRFEAAAVAVCKQYVQVFNTETTLGDTPTEAQSGRFLESIADSFDAMVVKLSAIPVAAADQTAVTNWLTQWRQYDAYGHTYAAAVSKGAERDLVAHDQTSIDGLLRRRNAFAKANHMSSCSFN